MGNRALHPSDLGECKLLVIAVGGCIKGSCVQILIALGEDRGECRDGQWVWKGSALQVARLDGDDLAIAGDDQAAVIFCIMCHQALVVQR